MDAINAEPLNFDPPSAIEGMDNEKEEKPYSNFLVGAFIGLASSSKGFGKVFLNHQVAELFSRGIVKPSFVISAITISTLALTILGMAIAYKLTGKNREKIPYILTLMASSNLALSGATAYIAYKASMRTPIECIAGIFISSLSWTAFLLKSIDYKKNVTHIKEI